MHAKAAEMQRLSKIKAVRRRRAIVSLRRARSRPWTYPSCGPGQRRVSAAECCDPFSELWTASRYHLRMESAGSAWKLVRSSSAARSAW
jgi:hypothetical protein